MLIRMYCVIASFCVFLATAIATDSAAQDRSSESKVNAITQKWITPTTAATLASPAGSKNYGFGPGDVLDVTIHNRDDLSGTRRVRQDYVISIPSLGTFNIANKSLALLEREISDRLPGSSVVVTVDKWRQLFVMGKVNKPGAFDFMPGMTVLHAVAYAGGTLRSLNVSSGLLLAFVNRKERENVVRRELIIDLTRQDVLLAESNGADRVRSSPELIELVGADRARQLEQTGTVLLAQRRKVRSETTKSLREQHRLGIEEVKAYEKQLKNIQEIQDLTKRSLREIRKLVARKLTVNSRLFRMEQLFGQTQASSNRVQAEYARAKRATARAKRRIAIVQAQYENKLDTEMHTLRARIAGSIRTLAASRAVTNDLPDPLLSTKNGVNSAGEQQKLSYRIVRTTSAGQTTIGASETSILHPGDLLQVN